MIKISKKERFILEKQYKLRIHEDINTTHSKPRKYYLTEKKRNLYLLEKIRNT